MEDHKKAEFLFKKGIAYFLNKNFVDAEFAFEDALNLEPNRISLLINLSLSQFFQKKYKSERAHNLHRRLGVTRTELGS